MVNRGFNILVVDDEPQIRELVELVMRDEGHAVTTAGGGSEALEVAQRNRFDVAIVDYQMPAPNGLEVLARMRVMQPNCVGLLVSGNLDLDAAIQAVNRGEAARILTKPFSVNDLLGAVGEAVQARRRIGEHFLSSSTAEYSQEAMQFEECLALNHLRLALQPIISAATGEVVAHEALLRSSHPVLARPMDVLGAAERQGQLPRLSTAVVAAAAAELGAVSAETRMFINVHPAELEDVEGFWHRLQPLMPWANRIVLEITERSRMENADSWRESTRRAVEAGFCIAVDDLGAGYSSLAALAELHPQFIKIDMSIIRGCDTDTHKRRLLELLCTFAQATGAHVVAEGIETEAERETVVKAGAHLLQGFLLGKPVLAPKRGRKT